MTTDEKIDKLAESHKALAESVELLKGSIHDQGDNIDKLLETTKAQGEQIEAQGKNFERIGGNIDRILELIERQASNIAGLATLAGQHQKRIEKLEDSQG